MKNEQLAIIVAALLAFGGFLTVYQSESDAAGGPFTVTDGIGNVFSFDEPVDKVVTLGKGMTSIALNLDCLEKIVVCDTYSANASETLFDSLRANVASGKVAAGGNIYPSGQEQLKKEIIAASDPSTGSFDKNSDAILMFGSPQYVDKLVEYFDGMGFKNILVWYTATDYSDIVKCTQTISKVLTGSESVGVETISETLDKINGTLSDEGRLGSGKGFYITYSANNWKVGNVGSLASSMIEVAGGKSVTVDSGKTGSTYQANPARIIETYGIDTVVFVDNVVAGDANKMSELRTMVGNQVKIVPLENLWNNYSFESINGVWTMACAMYPDLFSGDVPQVGGNGDNLLIYIIIGAVATVAIVASAVFFGRRI